MADIPCHRCLKFTADTNLANYSVSFVPSKWDFYTMQIRLCPDCIKEWIAYYRSFHLEDLRLGCDKSLDYDPKAMAHLWEIIFRDWFLNTKVNVDSVTQMYRASKCEKNSSQEKP